jgi:hypothetical protein
MNEFNLGTGAFESPKDKRDWTLASVGASTDYPKECFINLFETIKVNHQRKIGCCVGASFEAIVRKIQVELGLGDEELSYRFLYALAKCIDGASDEGTYPYLLPKIIRQYGVPLAKYCPNDTTLKHEDFVYQRNMANIPKEAFEDALKRRGGADFTVPITEEGIKRAINYAKENNGGVAILRRIGDTYWKDKKGSTWDGKRLLPIKVPKEFVSGHEEVLYGYEEKDGRTIIRWLNSWSDDWCENGTAWEYLDEWLKNIVELRVFVYSVPVVENFKYNFTKNLKKGDKGADVVALQHILKLEGVYPEGLAFTGNYQDKTFAGVKLLQEKYKKEILNPLGLFVGTGVFGYSTRAFINKKYK